MEYYLSLGANLGEREETLQKAIALLEERGVQVTAQSAFFYSEPWGFASSHGFCNCCVQVQTALAPETLLDLTQSVERELGRTHKTATDAAHQPLTGYSDRTIDIDLLVCMDDSGQCIRLHTERLTLPHPFMKERDFVMVPLREIAAEKDFDL